MVLTLPRKIILEDMLPQLQSSNISWDILRNRLQEHNILALSYCSNQNKFCCSNMLEFSDRPPPPPPSVHVYSERNDSGCERWLKSTLHRGGGNP